ncbi:hypothetical protein TTRE_0000268801 [Trichuris trichiura]|uniref:EGF-like domain-containing protein n=1 Tax=Trichuris trichiura TaxID=36087 RepID=A0A077Z419_TRITR|nr:hypothetical protein TTRE_0000268801 [Trichuris trichiura]
MFILFNGVTTAYALKPNVTCCNGGKPFVETSIWQADWNAFKELGPGGDPTQNCRVYELRISNQLMTKLLKRGDALICKCPTNHYGPSCELSHQAYTMAGDGQSFKMFLLLAVVPLTFALLAALGGFLCRMCCCHIIGFECFNISWRFGRNKDSDRVGNDFEPVSRDTRQAAPRANTEVYHALTGQQLVPTSQEYLPDSVYCGPPPSYEAAVRQCQSAAVPER